MDSITQAVLGAAVADAGLGRRLGRGAALWGLLLGTLPDLDVLAHPWLDPVEELAWHRGPSHGLVILLLATPALAWCIRRCHQRAAPGWWPTLLTVWLVLLTHVLIDLFTIYGTGIWEPFSAHRAASNNLFIIDPLFSLPLLIAALASLIFPADRPWRRPLTMGALGLATAYAAWSFTAKALIDRRFAQQLAAADLQVERWLSAPTAFNTVLWRCLAEGERDGRPGFWIGYASLFDDQAAIAWRWVPQKPELLGGWEDSRAARCVDWFSRGWYVVRLVDARPLLSDLRFGELTAFEPAIESVTRPWIFNFHLSADGHSFARPGSTSERGGDLFATLWRRLLGRRILPIDRSPPDGQP
ncbi:MAG: metal-dependent hydrolase [Planctomycetota bacterium]